MLRKLLTGKKKIVHKFQDSHEVKKSEPIFATKKTPAKLSMRRTTVLNKMFMTHISELIASGPAGQELSGLGLEITRIKVCQNYHGVNIFWTATAPCDFDYVEEKLASIKDAVRHDLHQMQVMGIVPHLTFVRDHELTYSQELSILFEKADYGDDYQPSYGRSKTMTDFQTQVGMNKEENDNESSVIPMRHDVFGLDHALIMGRVKQAMNKSKQAWTHFEQKQSPPTTSKPFTFNTSFESIREEQKSEKQSKDVLKEFLDKRRIERKIRRKKETELDAKLMLAHEDWINANYARVEDEDEDEDDCNQFENDDGEQFKYYNELDEDDL